MFGEQEHFGKLFHMCLELQNRGPHSGLGFRV